MSSGSRLLLITGVTSIAVLCTALGIWQVSRLKERRAVNAIALAARAAPPVELTGHSGDSGWTNRRVRVKGRYDHAHDVVLRGRAYRGVPGVEILSPLIADDGTAVLVNRGFVPSPDATTVIADSVRESGTVWVEGIALPIGSGPGSPLRHNQRTTWARLDRGGLGQTLPYPIYPFYVQQTPDSSLPRFPRRLDPPVLDDGPHLFYAIQWFGFAAVAVAFGTAMLRKRPE
jgi:surfeit locus 1 family protein